MKTIIISIGGNSGNTVLDAANEIPEDLRSTDMIRILLMKVTYGNLTFRMSSLAMLKESSSFQTRTNFPQAAISQQLQSGSPKKRKNRLYMLYSRCLFQKEMTHTIKQRLFKKASSHFLLMYFCGLMVVS